MHLLYRLVIPAITGLASGAAITKHSHLTTSLSAGHAMQTRARDSPENGERKQVTDSLDDIKSMGMTVIRAWAFQDDPNNSRPVHYKTGNDASKC